MGEIAAGGGGPACAARAGCVQAGEIVGAGLAAALDDAGGDLCDDRMHGVWPYLQSYQRWPFRPTRVKASDGPQLPAG